ncbi:MAG: pyruvate carboxylase [Chitinophagaceae bacterium]|nr:pyruvate carboxylase [Oligoflexus sp.]
MNKRLLVANRGEIATRIFRAATELNMQTIALYSYEDRFSMHRFKADEAYKVGKKGDPLGAYLNWHDIVDLAVEKKIDMIHPGYGFLSENPDFADACEKNGILFCGPSPKVLQLFGDKLQAKQIARNAKVPVIPGTEAPVETLEEAREISKGLKYPVTLKALSGGGGKGIRIVHSEAELVEAFQRAKSEAMSSFGRSEIYLEKSIMNAKHIEVQIAGDKSGHVIHLYERDCSVQRRHQKLVEIAPALGISKQTRERLLEDSIKIAESVNYVGVGTVEFLVSENGEHYFLEVNPRIQVEHTVTEMITGVDLVQMSIMLPAGRSMSHPAIGIHSQADVRQSGVAIQCRITTENPQKNFAPDTGVILAYRPAQGFGIRLDEGMGTSGGIVTPYYDSLLVKVTAHSVDLIGAASKMSRALKEFRVRGIKTNMELLFNIVTHPMFAAGTIKTNFLELHPEVFEFPQPKDRATKILRFIADVTVNNPHKLHTKTPPKEVDIYELPKRTPVVGGPLTAKQIFDQRGVEGLKTWIHAQKQLLITDTTMRDAHQSLFATRLRNNDIYKATRFYEAATPGFFSLECWGGATFDTCLRFLKEDPWERLARIREEVPNSLLQMLLRGDNAVGYTNYPEWVIRDFIRLSAEAGLDLFRIFDCLNNPEQMAIAIDEVKKRGAIAEASICYTGNILDPRNQKYTLKYYLKIAKELEAMGSDILCIKDMAGLLRPRAATELVKALKDTIGIPIHLHMHASAGSSEASLLAAAEAGCDIVDGAVSTMAGLTSQPSINAIVASLEGTDRCPELKLSDLDELSRFWETIRAQYNAFDPGIKATSTDVYEHEIPGGQYSNLFDQAQKVGVKAAEFHELTIRYKEVNDLFGNIVKVTPSSKVVGDFALLLQKHGLNSSDLMAKKPVLDYPDSVVSFFQGHMGIPYGGFNKELREMVLGKNPPPPQKPPLVAGDSFEKAKTELSLLTEKTPTDTQVLSYRLYPKVYKDYLTSLREFGSVESLPTDVFFNGLDLNREVDIELEPGKTLIVSLSGITDPDKDGKRRVFFQLNGFPRNLEVIDESVTGVTKKRPKADSTNAEQIGSPMPGKILEIRAVAGNAVKKGDIVLITESMKMEYAITAKMDGKIKSIYVHKGELVEEGDLLLDIQP